MTAERLGHPANAPARARVLDYLGVPPAQVVDALIRLALGSVARLAIVPMQDLLGLDASARMNTPGTTTANWSWAFDWAQVPPAHSMPMVAPS